MNYYQILDISPDATLEEIKRAYRRLARQHHPDVAGSDAREQFLHIQAAYQILSDPTERRKFDLSFGVGLTPKTAIPYNPVRKASATSTTAQSPPPSQAAPPAPRPVRTSTTRSRPRSSDIPPPRPAPPPPPEEPTIESYEQGTIAIRQSLSQHRYATATRLAEQLVDRFPHHPQSTHLLAVSYHYRGNELLYYKQYDLAELYLYEALKTAAHHDEALRVAIQRDLDRVDVNRKEFTPPTTA
jgi:curved DNA-binding protein CbpA